MAKLVTPPGYVLPSKPRWGGGINLGAMLAAASMFVVASTAATEWVAQKLQNPIELGRAWFWFGKIGYFEPFGALKLWMQFAAKRSTPGVVQAVLWEGFAISVLGGLLFGYVAYWLVSLFRDRDSMKHNQSLHGSARWAEPAEIKKTGMLDATDGVYIGGWRNPRTKFLHYLLHNGPESVLLFAPSRSGKGVSCIIPTLLQWQNSVFVYDLKGENFELTAGYRHKMGQRVLRFAPSFPDESCCFNPLEEIRFGTNHDVSDATNIAEAVIRNGDDNTLYKHFEDAAVDLVTAGILHLGYVKLRQGKKVSLPDVLSWYSSPGEDFPALLQRMQREVHDPGGESSPVMHWIDCRGAPTLTHPYVAEATQRQLNRADREGSGVQSSIVTPMSIYGDPLIKQTVSGSDFAIRDLVYGERPMSLYFKVPSPDQERLRPLVRLFLEVIFNRLMREQDMSPGRKPLLLMLDEFPQLKHMPNLERKLALMSGYKMRAFLITQTLSQIYAEYGQNEAITANCNVKIAFQTDDLTTCRLLSERSGNMTVEKETINYSGLRTDITLKHVFKSIEQVQRPLITPDEIQRMKAPVKAGNDPDGKILEPGDMLIFKAGLAPIYGTQSLYFLNPEFLRRSQIRLPTFRVARPASRLPGLNAEQLVNEAFAEVGHGGHTQSN